MAVDVASLQVSLPQMLDLALGTPEVGAVNFNILHNFLHVLLHQINLQSMKVEYRGDDANRIKTMVTSLKAGPTLQLQEYSVIDAANNAVQRAQDGGPVNVDVVTQDPDLQKSKGTRKKVGPAAEGESETVIFVEPIVDGATPTALGFKHLEQSVNELRQRFQALEELATTPELVERVKGKLTDPVTDVWQIISITNRLDASEQGIDKLTKMMQDVLKGNTIRRNTIEGDTIQQGTNKQDTKKQGTNKQDTNKQGTNKQDTNKQDTDKQDTDKQDTDKQDADKQDTDKQDADKQDTIEEDIIEEDETKSHAATEDLSNLENRVLNLENELDSLSQVVKNLQIISDRAMEEGEETLIEEQAATAKDDGQTAHRISITQLLGGIDVKQMHQDVATLQGQAAKMKDELHRLNEKIDKSQSELTQYIAAEQAKQKEFAWKSQQRSIQQPKSDGDKPVEDKPATKTAEKSDKPAETPKGTPKPAVKENPKVSSPQKDAAEAEKPVETIDPEELQAMNERIGKLEKTVSTLKEKVESASTAGVSSTAELDDLVSKIHGIQTDMDKLNQTADRLIDDRENREIHLNALLEQVELLKTIKADREDLEDALADKADAQAINRKVSYDQFDAACDDLAQGLEDAIGKLGKQETIWQQAMDEVQKEIEGKVDKIEMTPLKDFVHTRLKSLQEKVKTVAQMRQDDEAAGTKKLLKDVQCISCDKNVVMKVEDTHKFKPDMLTCTGSMKPYLTYELDQVRKQHRRLPHSRNMLQFEAAMQEEARKQKAAKSDTLVKTPRDHLCNRYCGGSHTVTTPQQRVTRMGHFLTQWGPEIIQLTEGVIKGTDGKMYKSRPMPGKFDVCGPSYCEDRGDEARPVEKSPRTPQGPRKSLEKQPTVAPKRRSGKKPSRELSADIIEELAESPAEEVERVRENVSDVSPYEGNDRVVRYLTDDDMDDLE